MDTYVIGVDCAAQHAKFGLALGHCGPSQVVVTEVTTGQADVLPGLQQWMASLRLEVDPEWLVASDDALDAVICVLAAADFARGRVHRPTEAAVVRKEGWIWFGTPEVNGVAAQPQADPVPRAPRAD